MDESKEKKSWIKKRSNCLFFACWRWRKYGGYLAIRKSRFGWWPHFIWVKDLKGVEMEHFAPVDPKHKKVPPPIFHGVIKNNDD